MTTDKQRLQEFRDVLSTLAPEFGLVAVVNYEGPGHGTGLVEIMYTRQVDSDEVQTLLIVFFYKLIQELHMLWVPKGTTAAEVSLQLIDLLAQALANYIDQHPEEV